MQRQRLIFVGIETGVRMLSPASTLLGQVGTVVGAALQCAASLAAYAAERCRTKELEKQFALRNEAIEAIYADRIEQGQIKLEARLRKMEADVSRERERLNLNLKKVEAQLEHDTHDFVQASEEYLTRNAMFLEIIRGQYELLQSFEPLIDELREHYSGRKEYIMYMDAQRRAYETMQRILHSTI